MILNLKKKLGQHLLNNNSILEKIASNAIGSSVVIEIGPGTGNLTEYLLKNISLKTLILIEKDPDMVLELKKRFSDNRIIILNEDATTIKIQNILATYNIAEKAFVIGNFPYNVGNSIIVNLLEQINYIVKIVALLQKEVVQRFCALPKTKDYGKLTVLSGLFCNAKKIMDVVPTNFTPPPKVMSSVLELTPKNNIITLEQYKNIVKFCNIGFNNRRKKLIPLLKQFYTTQEIEKITNIIKNDNARIEELSVDVISEIFLILK